MLGTGCWAGAAPPQCVKTPTFVSHGFFSRVSFPWPGDGEAQDRTRARAVRRGTLRRSVKPGLGAGSPLPALLGSAMLWVSPHPGLPDSPRDLALVRRQRGRELHRRGAAGGTVLWGHRGAILAVQGVSCFPDPQWPQPPTRQLPRGRDTTRHSRPRGTWPCPSLCPPGVPGCWGWEGPRRVEQRGGNFFLRGVSFLKPKPAPRAFQQVPTATIWSIKINLACLAAPVCGGRGGGGAGTRAGGRKLPAALTFERRLATAGP